MGAIITAFGKELRKMRIDAGEVLKTMATKLDITSSYLSAIEVGKRTVSEKFLAKLESIYELSAEKMEVLRKAIDEDSPKIEVNLQKTSKKQRSTALAFARTFQSLDDETLASIMKLLNEEGENDGNGI